MNFAPYQDESPELERALSPPPNNRKRPSLDTSQSRSPAPGHHASQTTPRASSDTGRLPPPSGLGGGRFVNRLTSSREERGQSLEAFETSLPLRLDYEAMMAYILLPPAGGVFLLIFEHKSDYVRFHAWQSSMLFSVIFILHLIVSWSPVLSWTLFAIDLVLIGFLALHAYQDVDNLDHFELPFFGPLANSFVDNE
ncbi:hypothetical protein A1O1_04604 [Capronia coronata CBS 617.96]|uniref:Uncharacterized protein n=1 Tax=Capronia coronata CBS 617.96 TaxID=1182541 RepID=W9YDC5_9EURO|nr:uncharacterized protein A1O1_04604 [Capronia coronata CBS 617.96]EXJ87680.1 hypothetical protein A1O1_04604 [Capronia coronata CBS 617.96]